MTDGTDELLWENQFEIALGECFLADFIVKQQKQSPKMLKSAQSSFD